MREFLLEEENSQSRFKSILILKCVLHWHFPIDHVLFSLCIFFSYLSMERIPQISNIFKLIKGWNLIKNGIRIFYIPFLNQCTRCFSFFCCCGWAFATVGVVACIPVVIVILIKFLKTIIHCLKYNFVL